MYRSGKRQATLRERRLSFIPPMRRRSPQQEELVSDVEEPMIIVYEQTVGTLYFDHNEGEWFFVNAENNKMQAIHLSDQTQEDTASKQPSDMDETQGNLSGIQESHFSTQVNPSGTQRSLSSIQGNLSRSRENLSDTERNLPSTSQKSNGDDVGLPTKVPQDIMSGLEDLLQGSSVTSKDQNLTETDRLNSKKSSGSKIWSGVANNDSSIIKKSCWNECLINRPKKTRKKYIKPKTKKMKNKSQKLIETKRGKKKQNAKENRIGKENKSEKKEDRPHKIKRRRSKPRKVKKKPIGSCKRNRESGSLRKIVSEDGETSKIKGYQGQSRK